jgi:hypothetical protein
MKERALKGEAISVQDVRVLTGRFMSMQLAIPAVRVWTRALYRDIAESKAEQTVLSKESGEELAFWEANLERLNGCAIASPRHELIAYADAGELGWGFHVNHREAAGQLPESVIGLSSTLRELTAVRLGLNVLVAMLKGKRVLLRLDSFAATRNLIKGGGPIPELCEEVKKIWTFCDDQKIRLTAVWVPRESNTRADELSKVVDGLWSISALGMALVTRALPTDAAARWWFPPVGKVGEVVRQGETQRGRLFLIAPKWPAQPWWKLVQERARFAVDIPNEMMIWQAANEGMFKRPNWEFFAAYLDFS